MQIHRVKSGETIYSIAREYGVSPRKIIENNGLKNPDSLAIGRELLILIPTRTYTARYGDTLEAISKRFSVSREELLKNNPALAGTEKIYPEEIFAVKYPEKNHGTLLLNGYLYRDYSAERLSFMLPYLSHLTLSACTYDRGKIRRLFRASEAVNNTKTLGKRLAMRIYIPNPEQTETESLISAAISEAKALGCEEITLAISGASENTGLYNSLSEIKNALLAEGLSLNIETDGSISKSCLSVPKTLILCRDDCLSSAEQSLELYKNFQNEAEPSSVFIDLSPFAYRNGAPVPIDEAMNIADREGAPISTSEDKMTLSFKWRSEEFILPSLENIKAKLDLIGELGYLGCSVDVMRCPISHLMMLSSLFHLAPDYFSGAM